MRAGADFLRKEGARVSRCEDPASPSREPPVWALEVPVRIARPSRLVSTALLVVAAACGGGGGGDNNGGTGPGPVSQDFDLTLSATTLSVEQGGSSSVTASVGRTGGFAGTVNLSAESVPSGLTVTFAPAAVPSGTPSTTVSVAAAGTLAPGNYSFTVRAQATGRTDRTGAVSVTVTARPAIAVALSATSASVAQGANTSYTATVSRTNFTAAVTIAVTGAPAGVTTTTSTTGDVTTVSVAVGATAAPGSYTHTTTASGTGVTAVAATFALTVTAAAPASIALTATPNAISAQAGGAGVPVTLGIVRTNFTGSVVIAVQSGLPAGVTTSVNPTGPTLGTSVVMTFTASAAAVPGTYTVVVQGAGFQATAGTVSIALTVTSAPTTGSIALSATPNLVALLRGQGGTVNIAITRSNYAGTVNLSATGAPSGVNLTLTPTSTTGNSVTLGIAVGTNAPTGSHTIVVTASGTGVATTQVSIPLNVAAPSAGGNVSWQFCAQTTIPIWVAAQDGDANAPWTQLAAGAGNSYSFNIGTRGGVAWVTQFGTGQYQLSIVYGSQAELNAQGTSQCANQSTNRPVSGTVVGFLSSTDQVSVALGSAFASPAPTQLAPNFSIPNAPTGLRDLIGTRATLDVSNALNPLTVNKVFIRRGLNPPFNGSVGTVDFTGADAFDPDVRTITVNGIVTGELVNSSNTFMTSTQSFGSLGATTLSSGNSLTIRTVPAARTAAGDVQMIATNAVTFSGNVTSQIRSVTNVFRDPANLSVTLGAAVNTPTISTLATAPYARLRAQAQRQSDYQDFFTTNFTQNGPGLQRTVSLTMTAAYLGGASTIDMAVPDFTSTSGWQNTWGPVVGVSAFWNVAMTGWISANNGLIEGAVFRVGQRQGTFTP
jgi:uncharacterized protein YdeI (BOF family)/uncharacterized membrane protein